MDKGNPREMVVKDLPEKFLKKPVEVLEETVEGDENLEFESDEFSGSEESSSAEDSDFETEEEVAACSTENFKK